MLSVLDKILLIDIYCVEHTVQLCMYAGCCQGIGIMKTTDYKTLLNEAVFLKLFGFFSL